MPTRSLARAFLRSQRAKRLSAEANFAIRMRNALLATNDNKDGGSVSWKPVVALLASEDGRFQVARMEEVSRWPLSSVAEQ